jgi:hypothetical protein
VPIKKKFLLLFLLFALMLLPVLVLSGLQVTQIFLKHSARQRLGENEPLVFTLHEADVVWEEQDQELRIGNKFIDVISVQRTSGKLVIKGYFDETETEVWLWMQQVLGVKNPTFLSRLLLLLQCLYAAALPLFLFGVPPHSALRQCRYFARLTFPLRKAPFIPPRMMFFAD